MAADVTEPPVPPRAVPSWADVSTGEVGQVPAPVVVSPTSVEPVVPGKRRIGRVIAGEARAGEALQREGLAW